MTRKPEQLVDLHVHLFNARSLPLAGIFAHAMDKEVAESRFAQFLAWLVNTIAESKYLPLHSAGIDLDNTEACIQAIGDIIGAEIGIQLNDDGLDPDSAPSDDQLKRFLQSDLYLALEGLEETLVGLEGIDITVKQAKSVASLQNWAAALVARGIHRLKKLARIPQDIGDVAAFILNILRKEQAIYEELMGEYSGLPKVRLVHQMMDMETAYIDLPKTTAEMVRPFYPYSPTQLLRMQGLARDNHPHILGFAAFDPRRGDWEALAHDAIQKGFIGFKFYPAMEYLPYGETCPILADRIHRFFQKCVDEKWPVFTHCTPVGFQTREKKGTNADPRHWEALLVNNPGFRELRLCFGHGGGDTVNEGTVQSGGWTAKPGQWDSPGNYAYQVARLCRTYPNLYCEFALLHDLLSPNDGEASAALERFQNNLADAMKQRSGEPYAFGDKIAFGTDWHMKSMVRRPHDYLDLSLRIFDDGTPYAGLREKFFWKNAYAYMKHPSL